MKWCHWIIPFKATYFVVKEVGGLPYWQPVDILYISKLYVIIRTCHVSLEITLKI